MEQWISGLAAAVLIPATAVALKSLIERLLSDRTKEVVTTDEEGRMESLSVPITASTQEIRRRVEEAYSFESEIEDALRRLQRSIRIVSAHAARDVDFVVEMPTGKVAVEVKLALDRLNPDMVRTYLRATDNVKHLLLVSRTPPSSKVLKAIEDFRGNSLVSFLTVPKGADATPLLEQAVKRADAGASVA